MKTKKIIVKINKRNLTGLINRTNFKNGGMFISYQFIAIDFDTTKNNTAKFYENRQVNENSWINYPGHKIWNNKNCSKYKKSDVLKEIEEMFDYYISEISMLYPNIKFELINF